MKPLCIAHRGRHDQYLENTKEAFEAAARSHVFGIETDVQFTRDGRGILHHDKEIVSDRKKYKIRSLLYEETLDLPLDNDQVHDNARVGKVEEYLNACIAGGKHPVIEIKNSPSLWMLKRLINAIDRRIGLEKVTIIAFYPWPLLKIRNLLHKDVHMQLLIGRQFTQVGLNVARILQLDIDLEYHLLTPRIVRQVHRRHRKVNVWTVDTLEDVRRLEAMGVDYITTNIFTQED